MIVMPGNDGGCHWGWLCGRFPGRIGSLVTPGRWKSPVGFAPYAIDNGAFTGFKEGAFLGLIEKARKHKPPLWILVPDKVGDKGETLRLWEGWAPRLAGLGWPLAFAVQDGMFPGDVPEGAEVVFVGGTTSWKWRNIRLWTDAFPRVHVGRVNTEKSLWVCHDLGAESCDGTGFFRNPGKELPKLLRYLEGTRDQTQQFDFVKL